MSKQTAVLKIKREADGFSGVLDGTQISFDKISKIVEALHDELGQLGPGSNQNIIERRRFIAYNDTLKGTPDYLGISKLAKKFGVSTGSISVDRKVIIDKGIVGEAPVKPEQEESTEPVKEPVIEPESEKTGKKSKKGKKGKK